MRGKAQTAARASRSRRRSRLASTPSEHPRLRPPARALRVLAARRRVQDRRAGGARRGVRPARARPDRPRRDERRGRALQGLRASTASSRSSAARSTSSTTTRPRRAGGSVERNHLTLLAADDAGYRNLVKLSSAGFLEGLQRGKPTVDLGAGRAPLRGGDRAHRLPGLALLPAPARGPRRRRARARRRAAARSSAPRTSTSRCRRTAWPTRTSATRGSSASPASSGGRLVGTGDVHYLRREDYDHHTALLCVQTKSTLAAPKMTFETNEFYLRDSDGDGRRLRGVARGDREHAGDRRALLRSRSSSASS